ncbi:hypothetical protein L4G92_06385 [Neisseria sp. ZJ106]|uniref:Methyl-accepting chemotaxis protein n=1 Tax=Neisseria lisongii TaxID=2912188 RepID=A0ABY7RKT5_9NEIS|nr:methyl-accepting chemotaxis protein [Neisseria lisongii]MCF7521674.1 hypothetical protein [Neisseria lisongii]WCL72239.1 hypothetical protein PJU73_03805 [Neisseria lisongii]
MFILDILKFLSPYSGKIEALPIFFFILIIFLFIFTWKNLSKNATQENWEANWDNKKLDIEQGTISELSSSVETKSEYIADTMPGIILIIGLLGTFIGLGLALDKASNILSSADMNNIDGSMGQLMQMMEGLGTKFKTSTWGLIAFLALKLISSKNNYEERRLNWTLSKVKSILDKKRQESGSASDKKQEDLLLSIAQLTNKLEKSQEENRKSNEHSLENVSRKQAETINISLSAIQEVAGSAHKQLLNSLNDLFNKLLMNQEQISQRNMTLLEHISKKQAELLNQQHLEFKDTTNMMSNTISQTIDLSFNKLLAQQTEHSEGNQENFKELAQKICTSIQIQQEHIVAAMEKNSAFLDKTAQESEKTRDAMDNFVNRSLETINSLKESASGMSQAAKDMGGSAAKLQTVIDSLAVEMNNLMSQMKEDLGNTISNMDKSFITNMEKMTQDLNTTIGDMSESFKQNMTEMSAGLGQATTDISNAVNQLSGSVNNTMTNVSNTINESMELQKKSQEVFTATSDNLNEQICAMTNLTNKLSEDINKGLTAISHSNRSMVSLDKRYNATSDQIEALVTSIQHIVENNQSLQPVLAEILQKMSNTNQLHDFLNRISQSCEKLEMLNLILNEQQKQTKIQSNLNLTPNSEGFNER